MRRSGMQVPAGAESQMTKQGPSGGNDRSARAERMNHDDYTSDNASGQRAGASAIPLRCGLGRTV